jgi:hypothetical protein
MALTYQLEKQFNGSSHLNDRPKPATIPKQSAPASARSEGSVEESGEQEAASEKDGKNVVGGQEQDVGGAKADDVSSEKKDEQAGKENNDGASEQEEDDQFDPNEFERKPLHGM